MTSSDEESATSPGKPAVEGALTTSYGLVRFSRAGSGPTVVLLHDLAQSRTSFDAIAGRLNPQCHLLAVDLLGHGSSDLAPSDLSIRAQGAAISEVLRDLSLENVVLVGHSLGGSVAIHVAAEHPELVRKLVLISAGCYDYRLSLAWRCLRSRFAWSVLGLVGGSGAVERALRLARVSTGAAKAKFDSLETRAGWAALGRAFRQCTSDEALSEMEDMVESEILHPALVIWGSENRLVPAAAARVLFRDRRGVRFVEVAGAAHAVHEEQPGIVVELVREFLE